MWYTPLGDRVLAGKEWDLFGLGLVAVVDEIVFSAESDDEISTGVDVIDRLPPGQSLALLARVGKALRDESEPAPNLTALTEGAVGAVYGGLLRLIVSEIDSSDAYPEARSIRRLVLAACRELEPEWRPLPRLSSKDVDRWSDLVDGLADRILWMDRDYALDDLMLDANPARRRAVLKRMNIPQDYFIDVAPDPTDAELAEVRVTLRELCGGWPLSLAPDSA